MKYVQHIATLSTGLAAAILAIMPLFVALDFGGVLWWTQYVASLTILVALTLSLPSLLSWTSHFRPRQLLPLLTLFAWTCYATFQTVDLSPGLVQTFSPASHAAYTQWLSPILPAEMMPTSFPISIAVDDSAHAAALVGMVFVLAWVSMQVFHTRARLVGLLSAVALTGATIATLGIIAQVFPGISFFNTIQDSPGVSFSTFINRNNAALTMNIGLAASFGLLGWRLSALTGQEIDGEDFEFIDLFSLTSDRDSLVGVLCGTLCLVGLLVCGSRSGICAVLFGTLLSLGWLRKRKGFTTVPVVLVCSAFALALLLVPLQLNFESIKRLEFTSENAETILNDGRFSHWPEGWQAAVNHLPAGSGLSTYSNAYLPFQNETPKSWFLHADNLWLELFVEQGIAGILVVLLLFLSVTWCLLKMSYSHDALDHGLRITGWYSLATILFTQTLDFGLIVPGNFLLIVPLFAAIVTRSAESDLLMPEDDESTSLLAKFWEHRFVRQTQMGLGIATVVAVMGTAFTSIGTLAEDTRSDSEARYVSQRLASGSLTMNVLRDLRPLLPQSPSSEVRTAQYAAIANLELRLARLEDVVGLNPKTQEELREVNQATRPNYRRLANTSFDEALKQSPSKLMALRRVKIKEGYVNATTAYQAILRRNPLDRNARQGLVITDFVDPNEERTRNLLSQLSELYVASASQTRDLAVLASQSGYSEMATGLWKRAILLSPARTVFLLRLINEYKNLELTEVLPDMPRIYRAVAQDIVGRRDKSRYDLLANLVDGLDCENCSTVEEKSKCLSLAAKALQAIGKYSDAITYAQEAVEVSPADSAIRLHLIELLRQDDQRSEALQQARIGRLNDPKELRFDTVIKKMAELDISGEVQP